LLLSKVRSKISNVNECHELNLEIFNENAIEEEDFLPGQSNENKEENMYMTSRSEELKIDVQIEKKTRR
jgi:hypothetical protein